MFIFKLTILTHFVSTMFDFFKLSQNSSQNEDLEKWKRAPINNCKNVIVQTFFGVK